MTEDTAQPEGPPIEHLTEPREGLPDLVTDDGHLQEALDAIADGTGPVAVDAERASGYRYGQHAYLVQLRRRGSGTWLIDPVPFEELAELGDLLSGTEWVLHAATQDIPCLAELGMRPTRLFDTELGARLAGLPKVGLAAALEHYLQVSLAKEHSAVDWSTRPLPEPWLRYAALDVELLVELRDALAADLESQGKADWAAQEFEALTHFEGTADRPDPWRRTSGMHRIRNRRGAALVRELWQAREEIARERDVSPGRVLPDATLIDLATRAPRTAASLVGERSAESTRSRQRRAHQGLTRYQGDWLAAIREGSALPDQDLPELSRRSDAPPPARAWADRDPVAAARLAQARQDLADLSEEHTIPVENLLTPDTVRRVLWEPPEPSDGGELTLDDLGSVLGAHGARPWQIQLVGPILHRAIGDHADDA